MKFYNKIYKNKSELKIYFCKIILNMFVNFNIIQTIEYFYY